MVDTIAAWVIVIFGCTVVLWAFWTLFVGIGRMIDFITGRRREHGPDGIRISGQPPIFYYGNMDQIPNWIGPQTYRAGRKCPSCKTYTVVIEREGEREHDAMLCPRCSTYGIVYPEFIEWEIPGQGTLVQSLDPTGP
jgi:hypothetical protein